MESIAPRVQYHRYNLLFIITINRISFPFHPKNWPIFLAMQNTSNPIYKMAKFTPISVICFNNIHHLHLLSILFPKVPTPYWILLHVKAAKASTTTGSTSIFLAVLRATNTKHLESWAIMPKPMHPLILFQLILIIHVGGFFHCIYTTSC